jgi:plasmid stabilization system protein ParE
LILSTADIKRNSTIYTCKGQISVDEIGKKVKSFYEGTPSRNVIWDFTEADLSSITADEIRALASGVERLAHSREGGKTAIVVPEDISYGFGRMYQIFAEIYAQIADIQVFRSRSEAEHWFSHK